MIFITNVASSLLFLIHLHLLFLLLSFNQALYLGVSIIVIFIDIFIIKFLIIRIFKYVLNEPIGCAPWYIIGALLVMQEILIVLILVSVLPAFLVRDLKDSFLRDGSSTLEDWVVIVTWNAMLENVWVRVKTLRSRWRVRWRLLLVLLMILGKRVMRRWVRDLCWVLLGC